MAQGSRRFVRSLPNILTGLRLCLAPLAAWLIYHHRFDEAFAVFLIAGITDALDGWIARRFDARTRLGAWLDPAADKALLVGAFALAAWVGIAPVWLAVLAIGRDVAIALAVAVGQALRRRMESDPLMISKINTVTQIVYILWTIGSHGLIPLPHGDISWVDHGFEIVTAAAVAASWGAYLARWLRLMQGRPR